MEKRHETQLSAASARGAASVDALRAAIRACDRSCFWQVQSVVLILFLLLSFARSETPCPAALTGPRALDPTKNLLVRDVAVRASPSLHVAMRLKAIKQDPRLERPEPSYLCIVVLLRLCFSLCCRVVHCSGACHRAWCLGSERMPPPSA